MLSPSLNSSFLKVKKLKLVKLLKLTFLDNFSKAEEEKYDQED